MSFLVKVGSIAVLSTDVATTTYAPTSFGFQPKALLIWGNSTGSGLADQTSGSQHGRFCKGFATGTGARYCVAVQAEDNSAVTDNDSMVRDDCVFIHLSNAGASNGRIDVQSIDADGFTLVVDEQFGNSIAIHYIALGGSDLSDVAVGTWTEPGSTGVQTIVSGLSFRPTFGLLALTQGTTINTRADSCGISIGAMDGTNEWVTLFGETNNLTDGDPWSYSRDGECIAMLDPAAAVDANSTNFRASFSSFASDGLAINVAERAASRLGIYLLMRGPRFKVTSIATRADGNDIVVTGAGVGTPRGCLVASNMVAETTADTPVNTAGGAVGFGAAESPTVRRAVSMHTADAAATTSAVNIVEFDEVYARLAHGSATIEALMGLVSFDADGATFVMDDPETGGSEAWAGVVLFGDASVVNGDLSAHIGEPITGSSVLN
jgi:hypothetical protein